MAEAPWLTILGLGEDGLAGLGQASRDALDAAEIVMGPPRHLALIGPVAAQTVEWPVPFSAGLETLRSHAGRRTVVLTSGDPFWFGAGSVIARTFDQADWQAFPGQSTFALAAARLGWPLEHIHCSGLHAAPIARLRPRLANGERAVLLLRDDAAVADLATWLTDAGFGDSAMYVLEALGGPNERRRDCTARQYDLTDVAHPVSVGLEMRGDGPTLSTASGQPDAWFDHDGQITKRPVRALTLSALAPQPGELLWDLGAGSGSVALEWLLSHPRTQAIAVERDPVRARRIEANAHRLGLDRLQVVKAEAADALGDLPAPQAVFIGGGLTERLLNMLWSMLAPGTRVVANAVTLETEALLTAASQQHGGGLMRIELATAEPLGRFHGWASARPLVQWSATR